MVRSFDPSNRSGQYCQSRTRVLVSEPLVRRPRGRVEEPSPWSRASLTFLPGRTVGREHRPTSRSVHVHSVATRGSPHIAVPSPPHISLPCARPPERMWTDAACPRPPPRRDPAHDLAQDRLDHHAPVPPARRHRPPRTFGLQGPTLGDLSDAYLQDYQVRQFRSVSTARGRVAHLTAFFGRVVRAAALTTHQIRQYQLARRAAGAATGTINRETSALHRMCTLAVHWGWLDTVPGFPDRLRENPPRQGFFEHPEYLAVRAHLPAPWQDILDVAYYSGWRKQEILGLTWDEIDEAGGVIRLSPGRSKTLVGRILPISATHRRGPGAAAGTPRPRQPARLPPRRHPRPPLAHGVAHRLPGGRGANPLPPRLPAHRRPQPDPRERPRAGRHAPDRAQEPRHLRPLQHY